MGVTYTLIYIPFENVRLVSVWVNDVWRRKRGQRGRRERQGAKGDKGDICGEGDGMKL